MVFGYTLGAKLRKEIVLESRILHRNLKSSFMKLSLSTALNGKLQHRNQVEEIDEQTSLLNTCILCIINFQKCKVLSCPLGSYSLYASLYAIP